MTKDDYYKRIVDIMDQAARDRDGLSTEEYADLCGMVEDDAQSRRLCAESDIENEAGDE